MPTIQEFLDHSAQWDWEEKHVSGSFSEPSGQEQEVSIHDIVESGTVLICAGPADIESSIAKSNVTGEDIGGIRIVPIGLVETAQINMNKPLSRIFEIGSKLSYIIPGRTVGGIALNRVFFDGPSLLKILYAGELREDGATQTQKYAKFASNIADGKNGHYFSHIGSGNIAMNLASSFFEQPTGLAFYFRDQQDDTVGQIYFEGCHITTYNMGISANMNVLTESVNMEFIRCRPIVTAAAYPDYVKGENLADINIVSPMPTGSDTSSGDAT